MKSINEAIDTVEFLMQDLEKVDCPLTHRFCNGLYIRQVFMKKDTFVTSMVHKTTHPFFVLKGSVSVFSENDGEQIIDAPYIGETKPNTRRMLYMHEDTIWVTVHITDIKPKDDSEESVLEAVELITEDIIEKYENELIGGHYKNNALIKKDDKLLTNNKNIMP